MKVSKIGENKMQTITLKQLLNNFWRFSEPITRDEINRLDWDELMLSLNICCPDAEGKNIIISDIDFRTYHNVAVSFQIIE